MPQKRSKGMHDGDGIALDAHNFSSLVRADSQDRLSMGPVTFCRPYSTLRGTGRGNGVWCFAWDRKDRSIVK